MTTNEMINHFDNEYEISDQEYNKWLNEKFQIDDGHYSMSFEPFLKQG